MTDFLQDIFAGMPGSDRILIWELKTKLSRWYETPEAVKPSTFKFDTYFALGSRPASLNLTSGQRGGNDHVSGIGALWLDIDIASEAHKKGSLPTTQEKGLELLAGAFPEWKPSYIINSGHGLQVYFLLSQWLVIDDSNRTEVSDLLLRFNTVWRSHCKDSGFDADSVCDLARVMRLPGTMNCKVPTDKQPVTILEATRRTYPFKWVSEFIMSRPVRADLAPVAAAKAKTAARKPEVCTDTASVEVPRDKWEALKATDKRIEQSYNYDRKDIGDCSASSYDMSLATYCVRAGWSDAEITALLIEARKKNGAKGKRPGYYPLTISKVRNEVAVIDGDVEPEALPKEMALTKLSDDLGIKIKNLTRYESDPPAYTLTIDGGLIISLGTIEALTRQTKFRDQLAAGAGILPRKLKPMDWDNAVRLLLSHAEHDNAGYETSEQGQCREWLNIYTTSAMIHDNRGDGLTSSEPWRESGEIYILLTPFKGWIAVHQQEKVTARTLGLSLRQIGAEPVSISKDDGSKSVRYAWKLPKDLWN